VKAKSDSNSSKLIDFESPCDSADTKVPHIVYFNNNHATTPVCTDQLQAIFRATWSLPSTWAQLGQELEQHHEFLTVHADLASSSIYTSPGEFVDTIRTIVKLLPTCKNLRIGVVIRDTTPLAVVKEFQRAGVQGILLDMRCYSVESVKSGVNAFFNGIPYWPRDILENLPGAVQKKRINSIQLTPRQQQIFTLIRERGASNKVIARTLKISESTVKLHVTGIFKKYGVRSRTQLAVFKLPESA
jgi:DNA-binding NarL/FixJ family response regulator